VIFQPWKQRCLYHRVQSLFNKKSIQGSVEIPDYTFEMGAMPNRFSTDIAKGVATVAGAKPPRTLVKMRFSTEPNSDNYGDLDG
jgi:hypothetical protein